ncbi:type III secretion system translocon subunit SctE [Limnobacter sp.]|uniref:type III secretion system translocon subunit SctE n=1 Tax=Limnobacter sp. TaxID=2003368 RepID=UPI0035183298
MNTPNPQAAAGDHPRVGESLVVAESSEGEGFYELMAEFWVGALKNMRDSLSQHIEGLSGAERQKAAQIREQVDKYIKEIEKQKRKGPMEKFMKVFAPILTAFSIMVAVVVPTPMTIAMAVMAVTMFLEPLISKAAGKESMIDQFMGKVIQELSKHLPPAVAAVITAVVVTVAILLITRGAASGISALGKAVGGPGASAATSAASHAAAVSGSTTSGTAGAAGAAGGTSRSFLQSLGGNLGITPQHSGFDAFAKITEYIETLLYMGKAGMDIDIAVLNFQLAKALKAYGIEQAYIEELTTIINMIWNGVNDVQQNMERLLDLLVDLFDKQEINIGI